MVTDVFGGPAWDGPKSMLERNPRRPASLAEDASCETARATKKLVPRAPVSVL